MQYLRAVRRAGADAALWRLESVPPFAREMASNAHLAKGKRLRRGGAIPGVRYGGKKSTEMTHRNESVLDSIRIPVPVVNPIKRWKIVRGDFVQVISGPEAGKRGRVLEVVRASNSVVVEGVRIVRVLAPVPGSETKKPVETESPIYVSRVAVVCPETQRPSKVGYRFLEDGTKVRIARVSGAIIPRPEVLSKRRRERPPDSPKCTPASVVLRRTFEDEEGLYEKYAGFKALIDKEQNSPAN